MHDPCGAGRSGLFAGPSAAYRFKLGKAILSLAYDRFSNKMNVRRFKSGGLRWNRRKRQKILVVDDEARIRRLLKMYLERENYKIEEAENGDEAIDKALGNEYDLILLDLMMPGTDGIEVCRQVRDKKATPIIMLTAKGEEANRVQGFEVGTDDYIVKPFSPREVVLRVKALLRRSSQTSYLNTDTTAKCSCFFSLIH